MHCKRPHKKCRPATRKKKKSAFRHDTKSASPRGIRAANLVICQKTGKHSRQVTADWQIPAWGWKGNKSPALQVFLLCFRKLIPQWYEVMGVQGSPKHHEEKDGRQGRGVEYTTVCLLPFHGSILWLLLVWEFSLGWKNTVLRSYSGLLTDQGPFFLGGLVAHGVSVFQTIDIKTGRGCRKLFFLILS